MLFLLIHPTVFDNCGFKSSLLGQDKFRSMSQVSLDQLNPQFSCWVQPWLVRFRFGYLQMAKAWSFNQHNSSKVSPGQSNSQFSQHICQFKRYKSRSSFRSVETSPCQVLNWWRQVQVQLQVNQDKSNSEVKSCESKSDFCEGLVQLNLKIAKPNLTLI